MSDKMDINEAVLVFDNAIMSKVEHRAWQTLKTAALAQQTNNTQSTPCLCKQCFSFKQCIGDEKFDAGNGL